VHTVEHCNLIERASECDFFRISSDTYVCPETKLAAALSAGTLLEITSLVMRGELKNGFAVIRPPGHHAEAGEAMGFCMYNNVAVAAQMARKSLGAERILIFDWDIHHGKDSTVDTHAAYTTLMYNTNLQATARSTSSNTTTTFSTRRSTGGTGGTFILGLVRFATVARGPKVLATV
jgi:acetoin utilization deacetylase AcuC-like enzyme